MNARIHPAFCILASAMIALLGQVTSYAASPDFGTTTPRGGQRGTEVKVTFTGNRLDDAQEVLFHQKGMSFKDLKVVDAKKVEATLVIAPDCRIGEHHIRLRCKSGTSYARNFWVSPYPTVLEVEPNDSIEAPQVITKNVTVEAKVKPEEIDYYKINAKKGERISVEIEALRINNIRQRVAMDPYVAIVNKDGFEIATSDDSALLKQESVISVIAPEDGDYFVEVRDA
ncbi:MAG: PPC domain-containing protein, partial [Verrucomicrobiota bacterium]